MTASPHRDLRTAAISIGAEIARI